MFRYVIFQPIANLTQITAFTKAKPDFGKVQSSQVYSDKVLTMELELKPAKRYLTQEQAHVEICGRDSKLYCKLENLSITGAALKVISAISMPRQKDVIKVTIYLKSLKKHHTLYGEIIWTHGLSIGAKFLDPITAKKKVSRNYSI